MYLLCYILIITSYKMEDYMKFAQKYPELINIISNTMNDYTKCIGHLFKTKKVGRDHTLSGYYR